MAITREILNSHPVSTLKKEISKTNIKGYSKMKKAEIVELMMKNKERFGHIKLAGKARKEAVAKGKEVLEKKKKKKFNVVGTKEGKENLDALSEAVSKSDKSKRVAKTKDVKPKKEDEPKLKRVAVEGYPWGDRITEDDLQNSYVYIDRIIAYDSKEDFKKKKKAGELGMLRNKEVLVLGNKVYIEVKKGKFQYKFLGFKKNYNLK